MPGGKRSISNSPQGVGRLNQRLVRMKIKMIKDKQPKPLHPTLISLLLLLICLL